ncbi:unnamed protein product, partial [Meganyctiphanes norvegica]
MNKDIDMKVKEEIEVHEEPLWSEDVEVSIKEESEYNIRDQETQDEEKPYQCISNHHTTHTGEKVYQGNQCEKDFPTNSNFIQHQRTHAVENLYHCNQCDKGFVSNSTFIKHRK